MNTLYNIYAINTSVPRANILASTTAYPVKGRFIRIVFTCALAELRN